MINGIQIHQKNKGNNVLLPNFQVISSTYNYVKFRKCLTFTFESSAFTHVIDVSISTKLIIYHKVLIIIMNNMIVLSCYQEICGFPRGNSSEMIVK